MIRGDTASISGPQPVRLRFSVDEYYRLYERGLISTPDFERAEIIDGVLIKKMSIGDRHAAVVTKLTRTLILNVAEDVLVRVQNPLRLDDFNEPEPDFVLADGKKYDGSRHPRPEDTLLVIEVCDSSLRSDRNDKLPLYAEAGVPEVWLVNLPNNIVEVHFEPEAGFYPTTKIFHSGETIVSTVLPLLSLSVDEVLS
jgi:Uma2 family endonuclease